MMKKLFAIVLALALMLSISAIAFADDASFDYSAYEPGATVIKDETSPTGYSAVFIYDSNKVVAANYGLVDIASVTLYSDCMKLYTYEEQTEGAIDGTYGHMPEEYTEGMYPAGGSGATRLDVELEDLGLGLFGCKIPLSSGAFVYNFTLTDSQGTAVSRLSDPSNPAAFNESTGCSDLSSMVYVPYDAETMNTDEWADRSLELPKTEGETGTYLETCYTGADDEVRGLAIYLPAGYDKDREEPYNVLYITHGTGGDLYGEEMRWLNEGAVKNINDNLGVDYVVVCMNNQDFAISGAGQPDWDFTKIEDDQINYIMPFVEANFNVSTEASGRAYAGLSMGGATTSNFLMYDGDVFGYYGIWSYANVNGADDYCNVDGLSAEATQQAVAANTDAKIMIAYGSWDFGQASCQSFSDILDTLGVSHEELEVPAAHDWENWQLVYAWAAQNFFFADAATAVEGSADDIAADADAEAIPAAEDTAAVTKSAGTRQTTKAASGTIEATLTIVNDLDDLDISELYMGFSSDTTWGDDLLGGDGLDAGYYIKFGAHIYYTADDTFDMKAVFSNGQDATFAGFDFASVSDPTDVTVRIGVDEDGYFTITVC